MYFGKKFLLNLYKKLSILYPGDDIAAQGGTQFVSALKYFLATDEFEKLMKRPCDTKEKDDKDLFVKCVGSVVYLSNIDSKVLFCTKNFANSFGESKDFDVGSNFFSANVLPQSMLKDDIFQFPSRTPKLLDVKKKVINTYAQGYENIAKDSDYLGGNDYKFALLFLWLNRYSNFNSKETIYKDCLENLTNKYTLKLIEALKWKDDSVKTEIEKLLGDVELVGQQEFLSKEDFHITEPIDQGDDVCEVESDETDFIKSFSQKIFYGVPGCGKSFKVNEIINKAVPNEKDKVYQVIRVVFHPDYTNADFVGQIMPLVEDGVEYRFKAGPFARILKHAYKEHSKQFFLVIEELNRGNAATIFGDLFQLLDRGKDGFSTYSVNNSDIASFIMSENDYYNDKDVPEAVDVGGDKWILDTPIRLPPNLSILATMNTSDQNVFTLDNAFQRRWGMEYIPNKLEYKEMTPPQQNQYDSVIGVTGVKWGVFRDVINEKISSPDFSISNAEDKQLGLFFINVDCDIKENAGTIAEKDFANKVLKYLWNDVFKRSREEIFADGINVFGDLISKFKGSNAFKNCFKIDFAEV